MAPGAPLTVRGLFTVCQPMRFTQWRLLRRRGLGMWREAIAQLGDEVVRLHGDDGRMLLDLVDAPRPPADTEAPPRLLARWDSLLLSHAPKARDRIIGMHHRDRVFSKNADVLPTFTIDGFVAGTWKLDRSGDAAQIALPFEGVPKDLQALLSGEAERVLAIIAADSARSVHFGS